MRRTAGGLTLLTVMLALTAPAQSTAKPPVHPAVTPAAAAPASPRQGRWQLVEGTEGIWGGIGLRLLDPGGQGATDKPVVLLACQRPPAFYMGVDALKPQAGAVAVDLSVAGKVFAVPMAATPPGGAAVEASGPIPAGLLDAVQATSTIQILYGDQSSAVYAAPDPRVVQGFLKVCRQIEGERGQGG